MELAAPLLGAPPRRAASPARALLLELTRVHPLLHAGAALLAFTALTAALSGAVLLTMLMAPDAATDDMRPQLPDWLLMGGDEDFLFAMSAADLDAMLPPPPEAPHALLLRLGTFGLSVLTTVAAAAQLECHYERCALKPCLRRATLLGAAAGGVAIAWSAMLAGDGTPLLARAELAAVLCTAAYSLLLFVWNAVRALALAEWIDATDDREEALDAAADAACDASAAACCSAARCADEELAIATMPLCHESDCCTDSAMMAWEVRPEDIDAAQLLCCSSDYGSDDKEENDDYSNPSSLPPAAAVRLLTELRLAHPLASAGAGILFFAAQVVALGCGVYAAAAADGPPADEANARARCARMCSLVLSAATIAVGAAVLRAEMRACVRPPPLRPALLVSGIAGAGAIAYTLAFTAALPGLQGLEVAVSVLTAAASIMLFFWNWVRYAALTELHNAADAEADEAEAGTRDDDKLAAKQAAAA